MITSLDELLARHEGLYREFLRVPAMSAGLYVLPAGTADPQSPHGQDEVYVVLAGRSGFELAGQRSEVAAGSVLYVAAGQDHRFVEVAEDLSVVVLFAPAEQEL